MAATLPADLGAQNAFPDKRWVGKSFSRAAKGYDRVADLQRQTGAGLLGKLPEGLYSPRTILDLGSGTGYCTALLAQRFPAAALIAVDIAESMLATLSQRPGLQEQAIRICGDGEALPLRDGSVNLVFSNLALQWCPDVSSVLGEFTRVLRPGGVLSFSTFGEATLRELRDAWATADQHTHVNAFLSPLAIEDALHKANCSDIAVSTERRVVAYPDVDTLLRELKNLGAHNVTQNRPRHLTGKGVFRKMMEAYALACSPSRIEASFEIVFCQARRAGMGAIKNDANELDNASN